MEIANTRDIASKVTVNDERWPVLVVTQRVEQLTDPERMASLELSNRVLTSHGNDRYAMVLDNRKAGPLPATQRKMMADYMERHAMRARSRCACTAFVSESMVMRTMLTAIMWLRKPEVETQVFGDLDEAIGWCRARLKNQAVGARDSLRAPTH